MSYETINTRLAEFDGEQAIVWHFGVSHERLVIRLGWGERVLFLLFKTVKG